MGKKPASAMARAAEDARSSLALPDSGSRPQSCVRNGTYGEILAAGRAIGEAFRRLRPGQAGTDGGKGGKPGTRKRAGLDLPAAARRRATGQETIGMRGDACCILAGNEQRSRQEMRQVFATTFEQYLHAVEEMVGRTLRGTSDTESLAALTGVLSSLSSASSRMGFARVQMLLDQLCLRLLLLDGDPDAAVAREVRLGILRDVFQLRKLAGQMKDSLD
jgi:hypothetical protein